MEDIKSIEEVATILYNNAMDMDYMDYEDTKEEDLNDLQEALYYLKACAQNEYNSDYFRTLWNILQHQN
jgi:hypothetical protein